jgi:hypothetical protein
LFGVSLPDYGAGLNVNGFAVDHTCLGIPTLDGKLSAFLSWFQSFGRTLSSSILAFEPTEHAIMTAAIAYAFTPSQRG